MDKPRKIGMYHNNQTGIVIANEAQRNEAIPFTISVIAPTSRNVSRPAWEKAISSDDSNFPAKDYFSRPVGIVMTCFDKLNEIQMEFLTIEHFRYIRRKLTY